VTSIAHDEHAGQRLGVHRALDPPGALPHIARVLDARTPANEYEAELDVEMLAIDATSFAAIRRHAGADPDGMASAIAEIVADRGKLQNPWTGSGGVLLGRVRAVGARHHARDQLAGGGLVVPLASLIAVPLSLEEVGPVDPSSPHVPVRGRAIVTGAMLCAPVPDDLAPEVALTALDVYPAASYVRELAGHTCRLLVLGAGHAGLLALAAAGTTIGPAGSVSAVDISEPALRRAQEVAPGMTAVRADVTAPVAVLQALAAAGAPKADLTLVCTSVEGAEGAALVATASTGTIVFFSTATRFAAAALGADAIGSQARLLIPNGLTEDRGEYALQLLRDVAPLRQAFMRHEGRA